MKKPPELVPWIKYPLAGAVFELTRVSPDTELAHRRLSEWHWQTGEWPEARLASAAELCRVPPARWPGIQAELRSLGWTTRRGRLSHSGVHQVRAQAVAAVSSAALAAAWAPSGAGRPSRLLGSRPVLRGPPMAQL